MPNHATLSARDFEYIDKTIRTPNQMQLSARKYIPRIKISGSQWIDTYKYQYQESFGKAIRQTNRQTDIPTVDTTIKEEEVPIIGFTAALDYSYEELARSQAVGYALLDNKILAVKRVLAEFENRLLFNGYDIGNPNRPDLLGLTSDSAKLGCQTTKAPCKFEDAVGNDTNSNKLRNWLQDAVTMINILGGSFSRKPVLLLPPKELSQLDRPYNQYSPNDTVLSMVTKFFDTVEAVNELSGEFNGQGKDMGLIMINTPDVMGFPDVMQPQTSPAVTDAYGVTRMSCRQRTGGLVLYQPQAVVQLTNIG